MSEFELTDEIISFIGRILRRIVHSDKQTRAKIQKLGLDVVPLNFYSNTPSLEEIEDSYEYSVSEPPYLDTRIFEREIMQSTLRQLLEFSAEFDPPAEGDENQPAGFFWNNDQFGYSDAMSYYCFIRLLRPASVVEIGSGFSTLIAVEAMEKNGAGTVHCIEPYPRKFLQEEKRIHLHVLKAQEIDAEFLNDTLQDDDILFIDSTHTVKTGSDCLHIYLRLLPNIRRNILVHVHDVFLPFGMPKQWLTDLQYFWTEQYLLLAFLTDNTRARVLYGSNYNAHWNSSLMVELMRGRSKPGGGSFWFRYDGRR